MNGILAIWNDRDAAVAEVYERWYVAEHVPERLAVPGFISARRYEALRGSPRFFTYYELDSPEVLTSPEYLARVAAPSPLTRQVMAGFRNMRRTSCSLAYRSSSAALGGFVVTAWVEPPVALDDARLAQAAATLARDPGVLNVQVWHAVAEGAPASTEAKLRPGGDSRIEAALVVDCMREPAGQELLARVDGLFGACVGARAGESATIVHMAIYHLLGAWNARREA